MDVERLLAADAADLDQQMRSIDLDAGLERVFATMDALDGPKSSLSEPECPAGRTAASRAPPPRPDPVRGPGTEQEEWVLRELSQREREAEEEETAWASRRIAELKEILGQPQEAAVWWRRAAAAGDLDAQDYVETDLS